MYGLSLWLHVIYFDSPFVVNCERKGHVPLLVFCTKSHIIHSLICSLLLLSLRSSQKSSEMAFWQCIANIELSILGNQTLKNFTKYHFVSAFSLGAFFRALVHWNASLPEDSLHINSDFVNIWENQFILAVQTIALDDNFFRFCLMWYFSDNVALAWYLCRYKTGVCLLGMCVQWTHTVHFIIRNGRYTHIPFLRRWSKSCAQYAFCFWKYVRSFALVKWNENSEKAKTTTITESNSRL